MKIDVLVLALLLPSPLLTQGLGDTAARERQKREEKMPAPPAKVYSDQDLLAAAPARPTDESVSSPGAPSGAKPAEGEESSPVDPLEKERQERKLLEAEWRVRFANAREQLAIAEANSWHEVVRTEFYKGIPVQMKVKEQVETGELKRARQALADLTEEFRHTGFPPGWSRE